MLTHVRGFTAIELLVVVAIMALLVALLLPALGQARHLSQRLQCATQMRQVGQGMYMHIDDSRDRLPYAVQVLAGFETVHAFDDAIAPYIGSNLGSDERWLAAVPVAKGNALLICPADQTVDAPPNAHEATRSYAMVEGERDHDDLAGLGLRWRESSPTVEHIIPSEFPRRYRFSDVPAPSHALLAVEHSYLPPVGAGPLNRKNTQGSRFGAQVRAARNQMPELSAVNPRVQWVHGVRSDPVYNYLFADGRVQTHRPVDTIGSNASLTDTYSGGYWAGQPAN